MVIVKTYFATSQLENEFPPEFVNVINSADKQSPTQQILLKVLKNRNYHFMS